MRKAREGEAEDKEECCCLRPSPPKSDVERVVTLCSLPLVLSYLISDVLLLSIDEASNVDPRPQRETGVKVRRYEKVRNERREKGNNSTAFE